MTMTDGWVGSRVSEDPTEIAALAAAPVAAHTPLPIEEAKPAKKQAATSKRRKSGGISVGKVFAALLLAGGSFFAWPYVAGLLEAEPLPDVVGPLGAPTQVLVLDGDTMHLEGTVPSEEALQAFEAIATDVVGEDRVVNNLSVSDDAVYDPEQALQLTVAGTVLFSTGRADVGEQYGPLIDLAVEILVARESVTLHVVGHTDDIGDDSTNLNLSVARAEATKDLIVAQGVNADRVTTEGLGEAEPLASNDTETGRQTNRRVEFLVTGMLD